MAQPGGNDMDLNPSQQQRGGTQVVQPGVPVAAMTATVIARAASNGRQQRQATVHNSRKIRANLRYVRPEIAEGRVFRRTALGTFKQCDCGSRNSKE